MDLYTLLYVLFELLVYPGLFTIVFLVIITQWFLRKLAGRIQYRRGPTYTGPAGVLQPVADFLKLLAKEDVVNRFGIRYSPLIIIVLAIGGLTAVLVTTPIAPLPVYSGYDFIIITYLLLLSPLALAYISLSNPNPYSVYGVGRYLALLITADPLYVITFFVPVIIASKHYGVLFSMYKTSIVSHLLWSLSPASTVSMLLGSIAGFIALLAVMMVKPFDFPEAESELYWGMFTELGGPRLAMVFFLKFVEKIVFPIIYVLFFLGGVWPYTNDWLFGTIVVFIKYFIVLTVIGVIENSMPRYRPDQGIVFLWKYVYPLAILSLIASLMA